jgi:hypothetical protein
LGHTVLASYCRETGRAIRALSAADILQNANHFTLDPPRARRGSPQLPLRFANIDNQREVLVVGELGKAERSANKHSNSENQGTQSFARHAPAEPLWILVGSYPERGHPDSIFQFADVNNIKQIEPGVKAAWVRVTYWFNINYDNKGPLKRRLLQAVGDSNIQQAITSAAPIEGGLFLAEFNCSADLWKTIDYDKWKPIAPSSIEASEESLVCAEP